MTSNSKLLTRQRAWQIRFPEKRRAHEIVRAALLRGTLVKQPCADCGTSDNVDGHHEDYRFPLDVTWLCRKHHAARHRKPIVTGPGGAKEKSGRPKRSAGGESTNHKRAEKRFSPTSTRSSEASK